MAKPQRKSQSGSWHEEIAKKFKISSACLVEWFQPVKDGVVAVCAEENTFRVVGRGSLGVFEEGVNSVGHFLLATWELGKTGEITAFLHIIDEVVTTENGLLSYIADVTPGSSGSLLIHVQAGLQPTIVGVNFAAIVDIPIGFALPITHACLTQVAECSGKRKQKEEQALIEADPSVAAGVVRAASVLPNALRDSSL